MLPKVQAIIPAAGVGARLKSRVAKPFILLNGKPLLFYSLAVFEKSPLVESVVIAGHPKGLGAIKRLVKKFRFKKVARIVAGGQTRCKSVANALKAIDRGTQYVAVHDAARPFISREALEAAIKTCFKESAVVVAVPVKSTIKKVDPKNLYVQETLIRDTLWEIQTPQIFKKDVLIKAHKVMACCDPTDDAVLVEKIGVKVKIVKGHYHNIKVTTPEDLKIARSFL